MAKRMAASKRPDGTPINGRSTKNPEPRLPVPLSRRELVTVVQGLMVLQHVMGTAMEAPDNAALVNFLDNGPQLLSEGECMTLVVRLRSMTV